MCTVLLHLDPEASWPVLLATNRDELDSRSFRPPGRHWPNFPDVRGGRDDTAGGTWMAVRDDGFAAIVLNRPMTLGPAPGLASRGQLPLLALTHPSPGAAAHAIAHEATSRWRPCNLVLVSRNEALSVTLRGDTPPLVEPIPAGRHVFAAGARNDPRFARIRGVFPDWWAAPLPARITDPDGWAPWIALLGRREPARDDDPLSAMNIDTPFGFRTTSASLLALARDPLLPPWWAFASGAPDRAAFQPVSL